MPCIEKDCNSFFRVTGMLPPGKSEPADIAGQDEFSRDEVRQKLWDLYSRAVTGADELNAKLAERDAVINKLPKTADGVVHARYDNLNLYHPSHTNYRTHTFNILIWSNDRWLTAGWAGDRVPVSECYSTPEAAQAAVEAQ